MKQFMLKHKKAIGIATGFVLIAGISFSFIDSPLVTQVLNEQQVQDTIPEKKKDDAMTMKEFDNLIKDLDKEMLQVSEEVKKIDVEAMLKNVDVSLKEMDLAKLSKDIELSLKDVDVEKIMAEVQSSLKDINWEKENAEVTEALKEAKEEIAKAKVEIEKVDMEEVKKELANARAEMEKSKAEIAKIDVDKIMKEAKEGIDKAKEELSAIKTMFTEMEKDGLISSKEGFKIEYKNKDLYITGNKQKQSVTDKYRKYFKDEHFEIQIDKDQQ